MKKIVLVVAASLIMIAASFSIASFAQSSKAEEHTEWIAKTLKEIETIKVGMTRADLLKVFKEEGGISTRTWRQYAYHECAYIKVDVEFEPVGEGQDKITQQPEDKIVKISKPFLEWGVID